MLLPVFSYFTQFQCLYLFFICPPEFNSFLQLQISFLLLFNLHCLGHSAWFVYSSTNTLYTPTWQSAFPHLGFPRLDSLFSLLPLQPPYHPPDLLKFSPLFKNRIQLTMLFLTNDFSLSLSSFPLILLNSHILYSLCHINES